MGRLLAIDYGRRRCGIAATAPRVVRLSDGKIVKDEHQEVDWL